MFGISILHVTVPFPSRPYYKVSSMKFLLLFSKSSVYGNDSCLFINFVSPDPNESCFAALLQHQHHLHPTHLIKSETRLTWGVFPLVQREAYLQETAEEKKKREQLSGKNSKRERNKTKTRNLPLSLFFKHRPLVACVEVRRRVLSSPLH